MPFPISCEREGTNNENLPETHAIIKKIRRGARRLRPGKVLLAEANQWPEDVSAYFGDGDECHMAYHFPLMPRIYMAIAQEDRFPITDILRQTPDIPENCQWAMFLRNHDELTLEMVTDVERDYLWSTYATDPRARINLGIRRRLAPLMDNDRRKIELMNSLLLSLPGTPIIYYGDEIGMGDNIYLGDRNGVRTPMQWTPDRNGGFSRCDPARLFLPVDHGPGLRLSGGQRRSAVAQPVVAAELDQAHDRGAHVQQVFGRGSLTFIRPANRSVLVYVRQYRTRSCSASPTCRARRRRPRSISPPGTAACRCEMLGRTRFPASATGLIVVTLAPYGFFWFQLCDQPEPKDRAAVREFATLVWADGGIRCSGTAAARARARRAAALPARAALVCRKGAGPAHAQAASEHSAGTRWQPRVVILDVPRAATAGALSASADREVDPVRSDRATTANAVAAVRRGSREGTLVDVSADPEFISRCCGRSMQAQRSTRTGAAGVLRRPGRSRRCRRRRWKRSRRRTASSPTPRIVDASYVVKLFRAQRRRPSGDRDRALPDRAGRLQQRPRCSARSNWSRRTAKRARGRARLRRKPGRRLDGDQRVPRSLHRRPARAASAATPGDSRSSRPICSAAADRPSNGRTAARARESAGYPRLCAGADRRRGHRGMDRDAGRRARRRSSSGREVRRSRRLRPGAGRAAAGSGGRDPGHMRARCRQHRGGENSPSRRLPSRPGADGQGRRLHPRFRGRAGPQLAERRRKAPAARDVAGLLRSIDYSATAALSTRPASAGGAPHPAPTLESGARTRRRHSGAPTARPAIRRCGRPIRRRRSACSISSCSKRRSTKSNMS